MGETTGGIVLVGGKTHPADQCFKTRLTPEGIVPRPHIEHFDSVVRFVSLFQPLDRRICVAEFCVHLGKFAGPNVPVLSRPLQIQ